LHRSADSILLKFVRGSLLECCSPAPGEFDRYVLLGILMTESKESPNRVVVGLAWYRPEQWQRVRDISADADDLEDSYDKWLRLAEQKLQELKASGYAFEKVDVNSESLIRWCNERGVEVDGHARSQYAADRLRQMHGD
jgi:hypothetical protein